MKRSLKIALLFLLPLITGAQQTTIDRLIREVNITQNDTAKLIGLRAIARDYSEINPDSAYHYAEKSLLLASQLHLKMDEVGALREMAYSFSNRGNYPRSLQTFLAAMAILNDPESEKRVLVGKFPNDDEQDYRMASPHAQRLNQIALTHQGFGMLYANFNNDEKAWSHHLQARQNAEQSGNVVAQSIVNLTMTRVYLNLKKNDSALISIQQAYRLLLQSGYRKYLGSVLLNMGRVYAALGNRALANEYYRKSLIASAEQGYFRGIVASSLLLADYYTEFGKNDSAFQYIMHALSEARNLDAPDLLLRSYTSLTRYYRAAGNNDSAVKYQALIIKINDSLFNAKQAQQFQNIGFEEQQRQQEIEATQKTFRTRLRMYALLAGLSIILFIAIMLWRNSQQRKKANLLLSKQKAELESTLSTLKATQSQLIHSEKMASLGELTAGIAHEIQNPLNFVNNFSEVNDELLKELNAEADRGNLEEVKAIAKDIAFNSEKINHHGKRADAIVKGMLQHSRADSGQKEPTDINALCDDYLRLAYHGLRAKDKSFNAITKTEFDNGIGKINVNPQDMGRVILNLINNAFYAVNEKAKQNLNSYEPTVIVSTKKLNAKVEISVKDNGNGVPQKALDKVFQPFFTTKPTGQGTGLGLSLSYDIVKAHGGEIKVNTKEGEGSEFIIQLRTN
jgi:two-component system, NtrC family, sensor kinase